MSYVFFILVSLITVTGNVTNGADSLFALAESAESDGMYLSADTLYLEAYYEYLNNSNQYMADICRNSSYRMRRITLEFSLSREEADSIFALRCPWLSDSERDWYFNAGKVDCMEFEGSVHYFEDCISNVLFRNFELMHEYGERHNSGDVFYDALKDIIFRPVGSGYSQHAWKPQINPVTFLVEGSMTLSRSELPESGTLYLWIPVPIQSGDQTNPIILSISPSEYTIYPPTTDCSLGTAYMEIPLDSIRDDLVVSLQSIHTHFERSTIVDPDMVLEYDMDDPVYQLYTKSNPNITVSPEIEALAQSIVGQEDNPYIQTEMLYHYVVDNVPYSHVPHLSISARGISESQYCHEHGYGDCGMQSMYFCALCRSLGIPARACGGLQLVPGVEGDHFWAEFMIPGYGWIPADVTVAESADWSWCLTDDQKQVFKDYFFGNLDPYRMVIQQDVSVPLSPEPLEPVAFPTAIQFPAAVCTESIQDPSFITGMNWSVEVTPLNK